MDHRTSRIGILAALKIGNHYPHRYRMLVCDPKVNSVDEIDPQDGQYVIKRRVERSVQAGIFVRRLDNLRRSSILREGWQWRGRSRKVIPNQPLSTLTHVPKAMPIDYYSPDFYNDLSGVQQAMFADASTVALSPDPSRILRNGKRHPDEKLTDKDFFDKYAEGSCLSIGNVNLGDDQEEMTSQDGYKTESNHSMDIESGGGSMADDATTTLGQVARFVNMAEQAGVGAATLRRTCSFVRKTILALSSMCECCPCYQVPPS